MKYFILPFLFVSTLCADIIEELNSNLPEILNKTPSIKGDFLKVEPFPDQGGSFINDVYLITTDCGEELALKVENKNWTDRKTINEVISINHVARLTTIPVPHVLRYVNDLQASSIRQEYILMKRIKGQPLNHAINEIYQDKKRYFKVLNQLADVMAQLNSIQFDSMGSFSMKEGCSIGASIEFPEYIASKPSENFAQHAVCWLTYYCDEMKRLVKTNHPNQKVFAYFIPKFEHMLESNDFDLLNEDNDKFVYCHQDFVMKNILIDEDKITAILDWEWSGPALLEFEYKTGFDFLFSQEDRDYFSALMKQRGLEHYFQPPPKNRQLYYQLIGHLYTLISCYEWIDGKLEHSAKFLDQKLEQRMVKSSPDIDMSSFVRSKAHALDQLIIKFNNIN
ncbi:MAG: aminoglycoside phosphotransferase family protein [Rhabdochlamydiaceae bacterium]|nr:aminoglycoside phosphotransferase family protein [Candidatus Amphrikana amoebophyrae]